MTPDMKRLIQAVKDSSAPLETLGLRSPKDMDLIYGSPEAIVRAVLMELLLATEDRHDCDRYYSGFSKYIQETINRILAEPASA